MGCRRAWRWACGALLSPALLLGAGACAERPPAVPGRDAGRDRPEDAAIALDAPYVRPPRPSLPPADLEVVLPYLGPPERVALDASATLGTLDVFLSIDTTGSFGGEIDELQSSLTRRVVPALAERVPDVAIGVGRFEDFPESPFGAPDDAPFRLVTPITTDLSRVGSAVASLDSPLGLGGDGPESGAEALYQIATGEGYAHGGRTYVEPWEGSRAPGAGTLGGVGFRAGALHVVVHVTDAPTHVPGDYEAVFPGTRSIPDATEALRAIEARAIGISSGSAPRLELEQIAIATGATVPPVAGECATGVRGAPRDPTAGVCPLVFDVAPDGSGLSTAIVDAIGDLLDTVAWREVWGESDDRLGLVRAIEAIEARVPTGSVPPGVADRRPPGDAIDDTFTEVRPGTEVVFEAVLRNETIEPADYDQIFRVTVTIVGDGLTLVTRTIRVTVPRGRLDAGAPTSGDAGESDAGPSDAGESDAGTSDDGESDAGPSDDAS